MNEPGRVERAFEDFRGEAVRFLDSRIAAHPELAQAIGLIRTEIVRARVPEPPPPPGRLPGCRHLQPALEMARTGPMADLAAAFERLEPCLRWIRTEHYRERLGDEYMANYGYTNLLGYDALIPHERVIVALFIIGPGRHYPRHHHEAEEVYFPFGGDTLWGQGDEAPRERPAGEPIHNTPWLDHEMITRKTPLFTFCFWISPGPIRPPRLAG